VTRLWFLTPLALVPLCSGCVAVAAAGVAGVGLVQHQRNEWAQDFPSTLQETWEASLEGLSHLGIDSPTATLGATEGVIQHENMQVRVERHAAGFTRVRVRIGTFYTSDHERRALLVLQEIAKSAERVDELRDWKEKVQGLNDSRNEPQQVEPPKG